jgi:multiple sugar transport system ATP-binding protein
VVGVRPEGFHVTDSGSGLHVIVAVVEELGSDSYLYCTAPVLPGAQITVRQEGMTTHARDSKVVLNPIAGSLHLFDAASGARLPD